MINWPVVLCGFFPLIACYITIPWFRAAVNRRLTFKPFDYDALDEILTDGMPEKLTISCLQATYRVNSPAHSHIDIYAHKDNVAVVRMLVDPNFPIARCFHDVLNANINAFAVKSHRPPTLIINQCLYPVVEYEYDDQYLLIYLKHK
ncbi:hypothetical protein pEaSNUABM22_00271 [Erwinia phage pEa_SNUABM_22]|uniref:Uncharacterized protein n=1 Tax=Erwinia phage pEa_SNUABM_22 TaxID=2869549 RepID=A0AAE9BUG7_9CAUD|nr:hypothetical protein MPK63_gp270 [Erwinia phage pEa_SNUABM_22]UAW96758.1 hypothetical protein pEaSNUABM22_00271 [Erwinia phage pEa_SNUABM_22]